MGYLDKVRKGPSNKPLRLMVIGVEGVGKSTAGAAMPSPIFICGEDGLVGPQFAETESFTPDSWAAVLAFCDELATAKHDYKTVVIDTLDWLEPLLYAHVVAAAKRNDVKSIEDFGYGKGYVLAQQEARQLLARLDRLTSAGMAVVVLSHCQIKSFHNPQGDDFDRYEPKVNAKIAGLFREWCDAVLFAQFDQYTKKENARAKAKAYGGENRIVHTTHSVAWDAKNRFGLPDVMPLDMPTILEAIAKGQPSDTSSMVAELKTLIPQMADAEKREKAEAWLKATHTAQQLAQMLNRVRAEIELNGKTEA
jgi:hypothetical protein